MMENNESNTVERSNILSTVKREHNVMMTKVEEPTFEVVNKISNLTLLTPTDIKRLASAQAFIISTYTDVPEYRPLVVKMSSVLNDGNFPTPDSKFWQCKKEAEVHFNQLVTEIYKYERCVVDIEEMDYIISSSEKQIKENDNKIDPIKMGFEIRRMKIKREEYIFNMKILEKSIKYRINEVVEWAAIAESTSHSCKYDTKNYNAHITESLYLKLQNEIKNGDKETSDTYIAQLSTLKRLLNQYQVNQTQ